ncbi:DUF362 domain-containing protein [uncultured Desulfovibrio sp.]|uniref:DUF362 domain-containing protein n=1 Tax=uncultured Desulfovibrio sp. TaxID=167968 RepID=UPI0003A1C82D|nr:DUF362 domain-containing protein [uncultured Desulfovibrio sp.]
MTDASSSVSRAAGPRALPVALLACPDYAAPRLRHAVFQALETAGPRVGAGWRVLVKPNLVTAQPLACSDPEVTAAVCAWLLEQGAKVDVADSPGFGRAEAVARKIGLEDALHPLKLRVRAMDRPVPVRPTLPAASSASPEDGPRFMISRRALECDLILSVPRVKAHSQMLLTLAVKNCFGCVSGLRKALIHTREGRDPGYFADCLAALWAALPPVAALADGVRAMHVTGPSRGKPFALGLIGASPSAVALDEALCAVLGLVPGATPLGAALERRRAEGCGAAGWRASYVLQRPEDFNARGFELPRELAHTSFHPARLVKSCVRRLWAACKP